MLRLSFAIVLVASTACRQEDPPDAPDTDGPTSDTDTGNPPLEGEDARLGSLDLGATELTPPFDPARRFYAVTASDLPATLAVVAEPMDDNAEVVVRLETLDGTLVSIDEALPIEADHRIRIDVVSADQTKTRSYAVGLLPDGFARPIVEGDAVAPGFTFLGAIGSESPLPHHKMIVDDMGTPTWWDAGKGFDLRVTGDGRVSWHGKPVGASQVRNVVLAEDAKSYDVNQGPGDIPSGWESVQMDEHEWDVFDDGTGARIILGKAIEDLSPWGAGPFTAVEHQKAQHVDMEGNVLFEWSTQGLLPYEQLPPRLYEDMVEDDWEPFHINSISIDPADGHWVLSLQRVSMVIKVARHGPQQGEVLWKFGNTGVGSDFTLIDDVRPSGWQGFAGQHDVRVSGPDRITMYDAGLGDSGNRGNPRFIEYQLDLDTMEATVVQQHEFLGWGNGLAGGSAQALPDGGVLVCMGSLRDGDDGSDVPQVVELSGGEEVWKLWMPAEQWTYRAWRHEGDPLTWTWSRAFSE